LVNALQGDVAAEMSDLGSAENELEVGTFSRLLEVYAPVRVRGGSRVIAIAEFYQLPTELEQEIAEARRRSWAVVAAVAVASYVLLAGIVKRGSDTIGRQQAALRLQVAELSRLLEQNASLSGRVALAARRATTLNEQVFRRIGADLHDGPGQALALALLRLDALGEQQSTLEGGAQSGDFATVHAAVHDAMADLRAIAAGLRLPDLGVRSVSEVARRAIRDHERRSGTSVRLTVEDDVPAEAPLAVKIALVRSLQEALSNATRHADGIDVSAALAVESGRLCLTVADGGPGFILEWAETEATGHLGLAGMRERAEILGGSFRVTSAPGQGTIVRLCWPLTERGLP
jgi:signal transduction histidine kinase